MKRYIDLTKKIIIVAIVCLFSSCTFRVEIPPIEVVSNVPRAEYDISESYKSVAMVALRPVGSHKRLGLGTAFAINENTLLTAGHVCSAISELRSTNIVTNEIYITYLGRSDKLASRKGAVIKNVDNVNDICQLDIKNHGLQPLKIADYNSVKLGDKTFIVGAPAGVMISITDGQVMDKKIQGLSREINGKMAVSSASTGGHSGSPILNDKGELIGMLVMGHTTYDHLSFGVPVPTIQRFMKFSGIKI